MFLKTEQTGSFLQKLFFNKQNVQDLFCFGNIFIFWTFFAFLVFLFNHADVFCTSRAFLFQRISFYQVFDIFSPSYLTFFTLGCSVRIYSRFSLFTSIFFIFVRFLEKFSKRTDISFPLDTFHASMQPSSTFQGNLFEHFYHVT